MAISAGDKIPDATFIVMGAEGPTPVPTAEYFAGKTVAFFAVPGAFTPTCHLKHVPSYIENAAALKAKGVDAIACVSVNDPFVMKAWGEATGATAAGIDMLADPEGAFTKAMGLDFSAPPVGLITRSQRYAAVAKDGVIEAIQVEGSPGEMVASSASAILELL